MLVIECYKDNKKTDYVKCPICNSGRLCDKPVAEKVTVVAANDSVRDNNGIILKCPKCKQKVIINISKE